MHAINPGKGKTLRYFAVVATMPSGKPSQPRLQSAEPLLTPSEPDGTVVRPILGARTGLVSAIGLECEVIDFRSAGTSFQKVGHERIAVIYSVSGRAKVDNEVLEAGEAALVDDAAGVAISGRPGLQVILTSAPRTP
jgi:hypothetical protein